MASEKNNNFQLLPLLLFLAVIIYIASYFFVYKPQDKKTSIFNSNPVINKDKIAVGYTLISPYNRVLTDEPNWIGKVYLVDILGNAVHNWNTKHQALYSELTPNGNLLSVMEIPKYSKPYPPGGNTGIIQKLDWDSKVIFEYKNDAMHHDIAQLPNGNLAVALWEPLPQDVAAQVQGGVAGTEMRPPKANPDEVPGVMWSDNIVELNQKGKVVWSWHSHEHMDPAIDIIGSLLPRSAWAFTNGLKYMPKNPIDGTAAYLLSMRTLSTVMIVRKEDGEIIWRSPKNMLSMQHDPTLLENGNILVFDNGLDRIPAPFALYGSRAVEINPKTNEVVWQFDGGKGVLDKIKFFSPIVGGAQRLENGNTLITDGARGHLFEVTKSGKVVWDLVNPYMTKMTGAFPNNFLFKTRRYQEDEIKWPQKLAPAFNKSEFDFYNLLGKIYPR